MTARRYIRPAGALARGVLVALGSLAIASVASASPVRGAYPAVGITGLGIFSCSTAQSSFRRDDRVNWILGFWSGLNMHSSEQVGGKTDLRMIIAEVENTCRSEPSTHLDAAVRSVYAKIAASGR